MHACVIVARVSRNDIRYRLREIGEFLSEQYRLKHPKKERDWRTYEERYSKRIRSAMKLLDPLIREAVDALHIGRGRGHPHALSLEHRVKILLIKEVVGESNRMFAYMLDLFSMLSGIEVSYKSVERLYSDGEVIMAVHNLHSLILRKQNVGKAETTGDGTGYSLSVKRNYESHASRMKEKAKENPGKKASKGKKRRLFAYSFRLLDLETGMYIAFGSSMKSEREAFDRAMKMLESLGIDLDSVRLDRYYSSPAYVDRFAGKVYVIPKKNATLNGSRKWKDTMKDFVQDTMGYLEQYHRRSLSESAFAADKRLLGWNIAQRRDDRIDTALFCSGLWHNMLNMGA